MLLVHASDIHLDSPMVGLEKYEGCPVDAIRGATRRALTRLVDVTIAEQAAALLIAGDLYDGAWRDYATGLFFVNEMRRLREAQIPVVLLRGNHDAESQITDSLRLPDNVHELPTRSPGTVELEAIGVAIHGQGFATRAVTDDLARGYPPARSALFNVGLLHTALGGREGHQPYAPTSLEVMSEKGYDYWALGHVHQREIVSREPYVVYPGNLQGRHVRETGEKGATFIDVEGGKVRSLEHRPLDVVRFADVRVDAQGADGDVDLVEGIASAIESEVARAEGRLLAARVTVHGRTRAHSAIARRPEGFVADVRAAALDVGGEGVWVGQVRLATRTPLDLEAVAGGSDPVGHLVRSLRAAREDPAVHDEVRAELAELLHKLPDEVKQDPALAWALGDPVATTGLLDDVEQLLVGRLLGGDLEP